MKFRIDILLMCLVLSACSPKKEQYDSQVADSTNKSGISRIAYDIEEGGLTFLKLDGDINEFIERYPNLRRERDEHFGIKFYEGTNLLLSVVSIENAIRKIWFFSEKFYTSDKIKVGMTMSDLIKIIGDKKIQLELDENEEAEELFMVDKNYNGRNIKMYIFVMSDDGKQLGKYINDEIGATSTKYNLTGKVSKILFECVQKSRP